MTGLIYFFQEMNEHMLSPQPIVIQPLLSFPGHDQVEESQDEAINYFYHETERLNWIEPTQDTDTSGFALTSVLLDHSYALDYKGTVLAYSMNSM